MWTVVYIAQSKEIAQKLRQSLEEGGLIVKVRPLSKHEDETDHSQGYEVLVPESEVPEAHGIIIETGF